MKIFLFFVFLFSFIFCSAKNVTLNKSELKSNQTDFQKIEIIVAEKFLGSEIFNYQIGDINLDFKDDYVVVLENTCEEGDYKINTSKCRKTVLLLNNGFGDFYLAAVNNEILHCSECGGGGVGDPFRGVSLAKGTLIFESLYGSCDKTLVIITFKFNKIENDFFLHSIQSENYSCRESSNTSIDIKTEKDFNKIRFSNFKGWDE